MMDWRQLARGSRGIPAPEFRPGDQVRVWYKIQERDRVRTAPFEGTIVRVRGGGSARTFTVRRVTFGEGVERIFFLDSPGIDRVEVLRQGKVHRSRLYYLRAVIGKTRIAAKEGDSAAGKSPEAIAGIAPERPADVEATATQPGTGAPQS